MDLQDDVCDALIQILTKYVQFKESISFNFNLAYEIDHVAAPEIKISRIMMLDCEELSSKVRGDADGNSDNTNSLLTVTSSEVGVTHPQILHVETSEKYSRADTPIMDCIIQSSTLDISDSVSIGDQLSSNSMNLASSAEKKDSYFTCRQCSQKFLHYYSLKKHVEQVHVTSPTYECHVCKMSLQTKAQLSEHNLTEHQGRQKDYICHYCGKSYYLQSSLVTHLKSHQDVLFNCMECSKRFSNSFKTKSGLAYHLKNPHGKSNLDKMKTSEREQVKKQIEEIYQKTSRSLFGEHSRRRNLKCPKCGYFYKSKAALKRHEARMHSSRRKYTCATCNEEFQHTKQLSEHARAHLSSSQVTFKCSVCSDVLQTKIGLERHLMAHAGQYFPCDLCKTSFSHHASLTRHRKQVHSGTSSRHICTDCQRIFSSEENLRLHSVVHSNSSQLTNCIKCNETFPSCQNLEDHIKKHHTDDCDQYICQECGKLFVTVLGISQHMTKHAAKQQNPYMCMTCRRTFSNITNLKQHTLVHTKIKDFKCVTCGRQFAHQNSLKRHRKKMHDNAEIEEALNK